MVKCTLAVCWARGRTFGSVHHRRPEGLAADELAGGWWQPSLYSDWFTCSSGGGLVVETTAKAYQAVSLQNPAKAEGTVAGGVPVF